MKLNSINTLHNLTIYKTMAKTIINSVPVILEMFLKFQANKNNKNGTQER